MADLPMDIQLRDRGLEYAVSLARFGTRKNKISDKVLEEAEAYYQFLKGNATKEED